MIQATSMKQALAMDTDETVEVREGSLHAWIRPRSYNLMCREIGEAVEAELLKSDFAEKIRGLIA